MEPPGDELETKSGLDVLVGFCSCPMAVEWTFSWFAGELPLVRSSSSLCWWLVSALNDDDDDDDEDDDEDEDDELVVVV